MKKIFCLIYFIISMNIIIFCIKIEEVSKVEMSFSFYSKPILLNNKIYYFDNKMNFNVYDITEERNKEILKINKNDWSFPMTNIDNEIYFVDNLNMILYSYNIKSSKLLVLFDFKNSKIQFSKGFSKVLFINNNIVYYKKNNDLNQIEIIIIKKNGGKIYEKIFKNTDIHDKIIQINNDLFFIFNNLLLKLNWDNFTFEYFDSIFYNSKIIGNKNNILFLESDKNVSAYELNSEIREIWNLEFNQYDIISKIDYYNDKMIVIGADIDEYYSDIYYISTVNIKTGNVELNEFKFKEPLEMSPNIICGEYLTIIFDYNKIIFVDNNNLNNQDIFNYSCSYAIFLDDKILIFSKDGLIIFKYYI